MATLMPEVSRVAAKMDPVQRGLTSLFVVAPLLGLFDPVSQQLVHSYAGPLLLGLIHTIVAFYLSGLDDTYCWRGLAFAGLGLVVEILALFSSGGIGPCGLWALPIGLGFMGAALFHGQGSVKAQVGLLALTLLSGAMLAVMDLPAPATVAAPTAALVFVVGFASLAIIRASEQAAADAVEALAQGRAAINPDTDHRAERHHAVLYARLTDVRGVGYFIVRRDGTVADPSPNLAAVIAGWPEASAFWQQLNEAAGLPTLWLGDGPSVRRNVLLVDPLGALRNFSITQSVLPAHTVGERRAGRLISVKDETERRARERMLTESSARLEAALREAQAASDAKTALLAGVSHELRTPLFTILGYAELVQETAEDNGYTAITTELGHIREAGKQLRQRIGDLLDLTEIESGTVKFTPRNIQLHEVVREAIESVDPQIKRHQATLRLDVEGLPARIVGDRLRIRQILVHLLSNAAKFAPGGQIQVQYEVAAPTPERPATLLVRVIDNGMGIPAAELPHIFEDFYQSRRDARHRPEGAGLGLTISRRLARAMGGDITVVSAQGSGSTFTLHLPLGPTS